MYSILQWKFWFDETLRFSNLLIHKHIFFLILNFVGESKRINIRHVKHKHMWSICLCMVCVTVDILRFMNEARNMLEKFILMNRTWEEQNKAHMKQIAVSGRFCPSRNFNSSDICSVKSQAIASLKVSELYLHTRFEQGNILLFQLQTVNIMLNILVNVLVFSFP